MGTAIVIGTVIGSGVFRKPHAVAKEVPEFGLAMLAWLAIGLVAIAGALALAEVAVLLPRAGGNYVFLREGFGRWAGFLYGWVEFWIIRSASIAALATVFAESLHDVLRGILTEDATGDVLPDWGTPAITVAAIVALALVNARGTIWGGGLQFAVTLVKVLSLVGIAVLPFVVLFLANGSASGPSTERLEPVWPSDVRSIVWTKVGAALIAIWWAYHGWMNVAPVAEEIRNPGRNIPLSLIAGTLTVMALYVSANFAYYLVVPREEMINKGGDQAVASLFCLSLLGKVGLMVASAAIMTSVFGALNGNLLVGPRLLYAMARDGLAPPALCRLHPRYRTPVVAELILAAWSIVLVVAVALLLRFPLPVLDVAGLEVNLSLKPGSRPTDAFDVLTDFAMFGSFSFETLAVASLFALRWRNPPDRVPLPYRCPLYPWLPVGYVLVMTAILASYFFKDTGEPYFALGFIAVGAMIYLLVFAGRATAKVESLP
jgi:amino acid transporter